MSLVLLNEDNAENVIGKQTEEYILFFHAGFAGPSNVMRGTLEAFSEVEGVTVLCADITHCTALASRYGIKAVPTIFHYSEPGTLNRAAKGALTFEQIKEVCG